MAWPADDAWTGATRAPAAAIIARGRSAGDLGQERGVVADLLDLPPQLGRRRVLVLHGLVPLHVQCAQKLVTVFTNE